MTTYSAMLRSQAPDSHGPELLVRVAVGTALLAFPRLIADTLIAEPAESDLVVARLLGARHLVQAAVTLRRPTSGVLAAGAATDALHGVTGLGYAALRPDRRRAALLSAAVALAFAASGLHRARS